MEQIWTKDSLSVVGLDLTIGDTHLLSSTDFKINYKDRIALLGRNGCGKTSLFKWIVEQSSISPWTIHEVKQELPPTNASVLQTVLSAHLERGRLWARQAELEQIDELSEIELIEYTNISEQLRAMKSDADPPRVKKILHGIGFSDEMMSCPIHTLSGGWRARVSLAQGLFMEPDLLLLDEPTNHLDLHGVIWLSDFLKKWRKTFIVISHNIGFVKEVALIQWLIKDKRINTYNCKYDRYIKLRLEEERTLLKKWEQLEKDVSILRKKNTPAAKKEAIALVNKRTAEGIHRPEKKYTPKFIFMEAEKNTYSGPLIKIQDISIGYTKGESILHNVTFSLHQACRVALLGKNGSGKSTLLKFLMNEIQHNGDVSCRSGLRICKFDQHFYHSLPNDQTPLEYLSSMTSNSKNISIDILHKILGASGLQSSTHTQRIETLSGGQKARVYFGAITIQAPDILLMDEPTNHLDIETIEGLIQALKEFPGAAVIVSHDIDFLEEVATEVWVTDNGTLNRLGEGTDGIYTYIDSVINLFNTE